MHGNHTDEQNVRSDGGTPPAVQSGPQSRSETITKSNVDQAPKQRVAAAAAGAGPTPESKPEA